MFHVLYSVYFISLLFSVISVTYLVNYLLIISVLSVSVGHGFRPCSPASFLSESDQVAVEALARPVVLSESMTTEGSTSKFMWLSAGFSAGSGIEGPSFLWSLGWRQGWQFLAMWASPQGSSQLGSLLHQSHQEHELADGNWNVL